MFNLNGTIKELTDAESCLKRLVDVSERLPGLYSAIVFWRSPLSDMIEERHIYADIEYECRFWLERMTEFYHNSGIPFAAYLNGGLNDSEGNLWSGS